MAHLRIETRDKNFNPVGAVRINQGEVYAGREPQCTYLRSCTCVGFYHPGCKVGAISHVTGFRNSEGHSGQGALQLLEQALEQYGLHCADCECFVIGGARGAETAYRQATDELKRRGIAFREIDTLGKAHRKLLLDPADGTLTLYKNETLKTSAAGPSNTADSQFHDPRRRVTTGASVFFRNTELLNLITEETLPNLLKEGRRLHIWCAGCSIGVETYSIAMIVLDWLARQNRTADLRVLGTDISDEALATAHAGAYPLGELSARGYQHILARYTRRIERYRVQIGPELRRVCLFKKRDTRQGSRSHRFELVVCDHVLQYFDEPEQMKFLEGIARGFTPGGYAYISTPSHEISLHIERGYGLRRLARHFYRVP